MHMKREDLDFLHCIHVNFSPSSVCIPGAGTDTATPVAEMICAAALPAVKHSCRTQQLVQLGRWAPTAREGRARASSARGLLSWGGGA